MGKLALIGKLLRTVKHLRPTQVYHQVLYKFKRAGKLESFRLDLDKTQVLSLSPLPEIKQVLKVDQQGKQFTFLNLTNQFPGEIDWNFMDHGKLWNYNLQYVDFLRQEDLSPEQKKTILLDLYQNLWNGTVPLEPYPVSLRIMNAIRFIGDNDGMDDVKKMVKAELNYLSQFLEFHILGNHLLENAFALLMGGQFFKHEAWVKTAERILFKELKEQTLQDGAHFELSPMYHQIIYFRVLEALDYLPKEASFTKFLFGIASRMNAWLQNISFNSGAIPHFNDSSDGIAFTTPQLIDFAQQLGVNKPQTGQMSDSGYRKYELEGLELIADVHGISPSYQPGHAHADTFSFCLNQNGKSIVVDTGISTYNICKQRDSERSTAAHNTVSVNGANSSEVWSGFRVGRRAKVKIESEESNRVQASHNGFGEHGIKHTRAFNLSEGKIVIRDEIKGKKPSTNAIANFHFADGTNIKSSDSGIVINDELLISFQGDCTIEQDNYFLCKGYNNLVEAPAIRVDIKGETLTTEITAL